MKTDTKDNLVESLNDDKSVSSDNILENAVISRLSRVVDMSAINGRSHQKSAAARRKPDKAFDKNSKTAGLSQKSSGISETPDSAMNLSKTEQINNGKSRNQTPKFSKKRPETEPRHKRLIAKPPVARPSDAPVPVSAPVIEPANTTASGHDADSTRHTVRFPAKNNAPKKDRLSIRAAKPIKVTAHKSRDKSFKKIESLPHNSEKIEDVLLLQSWHAKHWCESLEFISPTVLTNSHNVMPLVQAGLVNNICITPGRLEATIFDQVVSITLRQFTPGQWRVVIDMLSDRAIFATSLLNGELPEGILDIFKQASLSLFPSKIREFSFTCDCEPETAPCEHACALLVAFAQLLEDDPFQILTLRGMTRDCLLSQLRDARSDQVVDEKNRNRINYEMPAQNVDFDDFYSPHGDFETINLHINYSPSTLLKRLNSPEIWHAPFSVNEILYPIMDAAAHEAEQLGQCEHYEVEPPVEIDEADAAKNPDRQPGTNMAQNPSRAPKNANSKWCSVPDMHFIETDVAPEILAEVSGDPIQAAEDIYRWLKLKGASDIRTLARRTRLHKTTIEAFLKAFCDKGITNVEADGDKIKFTASPLR